MRFRSISLALVLACAAGLARAQETQPASPAPETVVAVVNGAKITRADVIASAKDLPAQYQAQVEAIFPQLLDRLIDLRLLAADGRKQNLQEDADVKARIAELTEQVIQEFAVRRHVEKGMTEDAIKARYQKFVADNPAETEVHALHVLLASEDEAKAVIVELAGGADFATVAKAKSTDPSAQENGGDLGYFVFDDMVPEFARAAFALEKGAVSQAPVQSQFGWHVIKVVDKREKAPPTLDQARGQVQELLSGELVTAYLTSLRSAATIERFNPDGTPQTPAQQQQQQQQ
jgi:peptidyl-prolyl cis-trans isomerase C